MRDAQGHFPSEASISEVSSSATSPGSSAMASSASHEYTFPPPPHSNTRRGQNYSLANAERSYDREHSSLPPLSPLSPQKRHLAPRTRLSIAISSPSPPPESPLRSPNVSVSSPFRTSHNSNNHMDTNAPSGAGVAVAQQSRQSLASPLISSFLRKTTSHASLSTPGGGSGGPTSPVRAHYHPYAYSSSPIDSIAPKLPSGAPDGSGTGFRDGGGGGDEPEVPVGQRYKRRGSLTLSLAPLSLSVSRHSRQSTMQHRRTTSSSSTASAPRTPLSPMAIPTLPDAVGMVQRNMTMGMNLAMGMSMGHGNDNNSGNLASGGSSILMNGSPSSGPAAAAPIMMVPSLPSLSVPVPPVGQASTSSISPSKHPRDRAAGKMRSMGHMRTGSGDRAARWEASPSTTSNGIGQRRSPQRTGTLSNEKERKRVIRQAASSTSFPPTNPASISTPASSYNSSSRQPPFFPRKNVTAPPTITVKTEDEDIDELAEDSLAASASASVSNALRSIDTDHEHEHDPGYASTRSAGSSSTGSFGYDAQDEMQLDDDDYASSFYDSATGLGGIPISARRRASLHPLDGTTPGPHHASHARSYSDNGPVVAGGGSSTSTLTSKHRHHAGAGGMYYSRPLPPSSYSSFTYPMPSSSNMNTSTVSASLAGMRISRRSHSSSSTSSSNSNSNSSPAGRAERDKWASNERRLNNNNNYHSGFASHSSSSGTRTPTGIASSSSRGNSAGTSSSPAPMQRRTPPSVVVSGAA